MGLFISGPLEGGFVGEGGLIERGAYLFIQKPAMADGDYLYEGGLLERGELIHFFTQKWGLIREGAYLRGGRAKWRDYGILIYGSFCSTKCLC